MKPLRIFQLCLVIILLTGASTHAESMEQAGSTLFRMLDPIGDDRGGGTITYPRDQAFHPYSDLLDLTQFQVRVDDEAIYFDLTMGALANPWNAPEGFFHPRIDIYIHTGGEGGRDHPLRRGPAVRFSPRYPWHVWLRVAPFGGTALFDAQDAPEALGKQKGVTATTSLNAPVITVRVEKNLLPPPSNSWRYYVMVGSFDGFGADGYRAIGEPLSQWLLGGDSAETQVPIVDLLAPRWGPDRQERQLRAGKNPLLRPVGGITLFDFSPVMVMGIGLVLMLPLIWIGHRFWTKSRRRN